MSRAIIFLRHISRVATFMLALGLSQVVSAFTVNPINGMWGIDSESNLAIGRAFAIELTTDVVVMTMYGYKQGGAPTFYVGAGALDASNKVVAPMYEPSGGTCLGCTPVSGVAGPKIGDALLEFTSSTTGFVTLPGETRKAMRKGGITWTDTPEMLYGNWIFNFSDSESKKVTALRVSFTEYRTSLMAGGTGRIVDPVEEIYCEQHRSGNYAGYTLCFKWIPSAQIWSHLLSTKWFGHNMDGIWYDPDDSYKAKPFTAKRIQYGSQGHSVILKRDTSALSPLTE